MPIIFSSQDVNLTSFSHTNAMVVTVHIDRWDVTKILIDNDNQAGILFVATFDKMGFDRKQLKEQSKPLYGFGSKRIEPVRTITLPVSFSTPKNPHTETLKKACQATKSIHFLREQPEQGETQPPTECKKVIEAEGEFQKVPLDPRVPNRIVCISTKGSQAARAGRVVEFPRQEQ
jgi:hypothetical protein